MKPLDIGKVMQLAEIKTAKRNGVDTLNTPPGTIAGELASAQVRSTIEAIVESINEAIAEDQGAIHLNPAAKLSGLASMQPVIIHEGFSTSPPAGTPPPDFNPHKED